MIRKLKKPTAIFILLSLFIHLSVVLVFTLSRVQGPPPIERVEIEFKSPEELIPPSDKRALKRQKQPAVSRDQIVEQLKQINEEVDKDSRFLSAFNQKVIKQTRAENSGKFNNTAQGSTKTEGSKTGKKDKKQIAEKTPDDMGDLPELKDLTPKFSMDPGQEGPKLDENGNPSATDDYLKDVQSGLQTLLSTREFVYYTYYNRIKEALRHHWEPNVREKVKIIYRQGRTIASAKDRVTQVLVTLNKEGELIKVEVLTQSGVIDLDNAAVEAFRNAAPFPNPPKGMVEPDGTIKIRWDFVLEA
ncbi:MAG: energy transducer TonB [Bdellovibrionales bacterium]|nr:energy transducer TonB [Bdellovibrionales bacterium]